jgi:hypothetical protein
MHKDVRKIELKKYNHYLWQLYECSKCKNKMQLSGIEKPENNAKEFIKHFDKHFQIN